MSGPNGPTAVNSWRDFVSDYGGFDTAYPPSPLAIAVFTYFQQGGTGAIICRAIAAATTSAPTVASFNFEDVATTPQATLQISALNAGLWGSSIYIDILPGSITDSTGKTASVTIQVKYKGTGQQYLVERFENLSMVPGSTNLGQNNFAPDVINSPISGSKYIFASAINQANLPANVVDPPPTNLPDYTGKYLGFQLPGGHDAPPGTGPNPPEPPPVPPTDPDLYNATLTLDNYPDRAIVLNLPGVIWTTTSGAISQAIAYAEGRQDTFVVVDPPVNMPPTDPSGTGGMVGAANAMTASPYAAIYYPNIVIPDPYSPGNAAVRLVPPGGFVTGLYMKTDQSRGVAKAPAGLAASLVGATGLELRISNTDVGNLTQARVNCIISVPGSGIVVWGARTLSAYLVTRYVNVERTLIYLVTNIVSLSRFAVFEPNDWVLWNQISQILAQFLQSFWQSGGLAGASAGQAFYVLCDATNNDPQSILNGIVNVEVGVALQRPAEFVVVKLGQWAGGQNLQISA
jgi:hypothetical protein